MYMYKNQILKDISTTSSISRKGNNVIYLSICFYLMKYTSSKAKRDPFLSKNDLIRINIYLLAFYFERGRRMGNPNSVPR